MFVLCKRYNTSIFIQPHMELNFDTDNLQYDMEKIGNFECTKSYIANDSILLSATHLICANSLLPYLLSSVSKKINVDVQHNIEHNIDARCCMGRTPLHYVAMSTATTADISLIPKLLEAGADINATCSGGKSALHYASIHSNSTSNVQCVKLLLNLGINASIKCKHNKTALYYACKYAHTSSNLDTVNILFNHSTPNHSEQPNIIYRLVKTSIINQFDACKIINDMLELHGSADIGLPDGSTLLHFVCDSPVTKLNESVVKLLLSYGASVDRVDKNGRTALYLACKNVRLYNQMQIVDQLVAYGSNICTVLKMVDVQWLRNKMTSIQSIMQNTIFKHLQKMSLVYTDIDCDKISKWSYDDPNSWYYDLSNQLHNGKISIDTSSNSLSYASNLIRLCTKFTSIYPHTLKLLSDLPVHAITIRDEFGLNALDIAVMDNNVSDETINKLIALGINPNSSDNIYRYTPLHYACESGSTSTVETLLKSGVNMRQVDSNGVVCLEKLLNSSHKNILKSDN